MWYPKQLVRHTETQIYLFSNNMVNNNNNIIYWPSIQVNKRKLIQLYWTISFAGRRFCYDLLEIQTKAKLPPGNWVCLVYHKYDEHIKNLNEAIRITDFKHVNCHFLYIIMSIVDPLIQYNLIAGHTQYTWYIIMTYSSYSSWYKWNEMNRALGHLCAHIG